MGEAAADAIRCTSPTIQPAGPAAAARISSPGMDLSEAKRSPTATTRNVCWRIRHGLTVAAANLNCPAQALAALSGPAVRANR